MFEELNNDELMAIDGGFCAWEFCVGLVCSVGAIACGTVSVICALDPVIISGAVFMGGLAVAMGGMAAFAFHEAFND